MIRIDPNVTELPKPVPWITALTIRFAVIVGHEILDSEKEQGKMSIRFWIKCFLGYHFWMLSDATNTKHCYHCNVQREMPAELWEVFKVNEGEYDLVPESK